MSSESYSKVTIIVENGDKTLTIRIPKARNLIRETQAIPITDLFNFESVKYSTESLDLSLSLTALFDSAAGHILVEETTTIAKEVKP